MGDITRSQCQLGMRDFGYELACGKGEEGKWDSEVWNGGMGGWKGQRGRFGRFPCLLVGATISLCLTIALQCMSWYSFLLLCFFTVRCSLISDSTIKIA